MLTVGYQGTYAQVWYVYLQQPLGTHINFSRITATFVTLITEKRKEGIQKERVMKWWTEGCIQLG